MTSNKRTTLDELKVNRLVGGTLTLENDALIIESGGSEVARFNSTGLVMNTTDISGVDEIKIGSGTAVAPSLSFTADNNTGLYRVGADAIGVTANGAQVGQFTTTGLVMNSNNVTGVAQIHVAAGTAAAPSVTFTGDTNSGLYSVGADAIGVTANGAQVGQFTTTGLVMNTTNVTGVSQLQVGSGTAVAPSITFTADVDTGLYRKAANTIAVAASGAEVGAWDTTGLTLAAGKNLTVPGVTTLSGNTILSSTAHVSRHNKIESTSGTVAISDAIADLSEKLFIIDLTAASCAITLTISDPATLAEDHYIVFHAAVHSGDGTKNLTIVADGGASWAVLNGTADLTVTPANGICDVRTFFVYKDGGTVRIV